MALGADHAYAALTQQYAAQGAAMDALAAEQALIQAGQTAAARADAYHQAERTAQQAGYVAVAEHEHARVTAAHSTALQAMVQWSADFEQRGRDFKDAQLLFTQAEAGLEATGVAAAAASNEATALHNNANMLATRAAGLEQERVQRAAEAGYRRAQALVANTEAANALSNERASSLVAQEAATAAALSANRVQQAEAAAVAADQRKVELAAQAAQANAAVAAALAAQQAAQEALAAAELDAVASHRASDEARVEADLLLSQAQTRRTEHEAAQHDAVLATQRAAAEEGAAEASQARFVDTSNVTRAAMTEAEQARQHAVQAEGKLALCLTEEQAARGRVTEAALSTQTIGQSLAASEANLIRATSQEALTRGARDTAVLHASAERQRHLSESAALAAAQQRQAHAAGEAAAHNAATLASHAAAAEASLRRATHYASPGALSPLAAASPLSVASPAAALLASLSPRAHASPYVAASPRGY